MRLTKKVFVGLFSMLKLNSGVEIGMGNENELRITESFEGSFGITQHVKARCKASDELYRGRRLFDDSI